MAEKPKVVIHEKYAGKCPESMVCVSDNVAMCLFIMSIISPGGGSGWGACFDQ